MYRIAIIDDHPMIREGLSNLIRLESDFEVCGEAEDRFQALEMIGRTHPDLAIVDLTLKNSSGLDLIKDLHVMHPKIRILVVSMQEEVHYAERVLRAGAHGYITKQEATRNVLLAIRQVIANDIYVSAAMATKIASSLLGQKHSSQATGVQALTDRELQVYGLIGKGFSTKEIASQLHVEVKTIETYRARIKEKLGLKDTPELLRNAIAWGQQFSQQR